ncbi:MAG: TolC family protein [Bacteroidales bacterium]
MQKLNFIIALTLFFFLTKGGFSQRQVISLKECLQRTKESNAKIRQARIDEEIMHQKTLKIAADGLPQIDASSQIIDNIKMQTILLPGEFFNKPGASIPVTMGSKINFQNTVSATQLIYNHTFWVGLKAAKTAEQLSNFITKYTEEEVMYQTAILYYNILISEEHKKNINNNIDRLNKIYEINKARFQNDLIKKVDLDRISVTRNELLSKRMLLEAQVKSLYNNLKVLMGQSAETEFKLNSSSFNSARLAAKYKPNATINFDNLTDFQVQKITTKLKELNVSAERSKRYPTLAAFGNYSQTAMTQNYGDLGKSDMWFGSSAIGLKLSFPIFNGFAIKRDVRKAKLELRQAKIELEDIKQQKQIDHENAANNLTANWQAYRSASMNRDLADDVFKQSLLIYKEDLVGLIDLLDAESKLFEADVNLAEQQLKYHIAELDLLKSEGNIESLIQ